MNFIRAGGWQAKHSQAISATFSSGTPSRTAAAMNLADTRMTRTFDAITLGETDYWCKWHSLVDQAEMWRK